MRHEKGFTMPFALVFSLFLLSVLIHTANLFLLEKKFYFEAEQMFRLDVLMHNGIQDLKNSNNDLPRSTLHYEQGEVTIDTIGSPVTFVTITCKTWEKRTYKAKFQYNKDTKEITKWHEER